MAPAEVGRTGSAGYLNSLSIMASWPACCCFHRALVPADVTLEERLSVEEKTPSEAEPSPSDESEAELDDERCEEKDEPRDDEARRPAVGKRGKPDDEGERPP